jgi:hypothetical protein
MTAAEALQISQKLIALALVQQTIEYIQLRNSLRTIWQWDVIRDDYRSAPWPLRKTLDLTLDYPNVLWLLVVQLLLATALLILPERSVAVAPALAGALLTSFLLNLRFRGTFNGGSDQMTFVVLLSLALAASLPLSKSVVVGYMCFHVCLSFVVAGVSKLRQPSWRTGAAVGQFMQVSHYAIPPRVTALSKIDAVARATAWMVIVSELCFPIAISNSVVAILCIGAATGFHILNFYIFGLNRFASAWIAAYPSVYYISSL